MNVYEYIAESNPDVIRVLCNQYGYAIQNVENGEDLAICLKQIVAEQGEPALRQLMDSHPDKDLILELYATSAAGNSEKKCKCSSEKKGAEVSRYISAAQGNNVMQQGNLFLIAAALILAVAIVVKK